MCFEGHEGLWDSPVAGSQTGWHPKSSFFIPETAVVSVTTQPTNGELLAQRGELAGSGCDGVEQCLELASWLGIVNTIPSTAGPSVRPSWSHTHADTSCYMHSVWPACHPWTAQDVSLYYLSACYERWRYRFFLTCFGTFLRSELKFSKKC